MDPKNKLLLVFLAGVGSGLVLPPLLRPLISKCCVSTQNPTTPTSSTTSTFSTSKDLPIRKLVDSEDGEVELVGSVDQGTTSTRFMLFDKEGQICFESQTPIKNISPEPGWLEQDPGQIFDSVIFCIEEVMKQVKSTLPHKKVIVRSIGITNQRETTILWDKISGAPLHNAIVWSDGRTSSVCQRVTQDCGGDKYYFASKCGLPVSTYFSAMKIRWMMEKVPAVKQACDNGSCVFGTVDTWLIWRLTGGAVHATDVTNASRTMLMNLETLNWDQSICEKLNIPTSILPTIHPSSHHYGVIQVGSLAGTPITGCIGDQQSAMLGQRCVNEGDIKNTYGTGCFMLMNTGRKIVHSKHGLLTTVGFKLGDEPPVYALEGSVAGAGSCIEWLKNNLRLISSPEETSVLASSVRNCGGVYFVPAFSGLFAPYWREDARGVIVGLTQYTTQAHIARATLEAIALQNTELVEAMKLDSQLNINRIYVDGGLSRSDFLLQLQADLVGITIAKPPNPETTALGAAIAAGLQVGFFDAKTILSEVKTQNFIPGLSVESRAKKMEEWKKAIQRSLDLA